MKKTSLFGWVGCAAVAALAACAGVSNSGTPAATPATAAPVPPPSSYSAANDPYRPADMKFPGKGTTSSWKQFWEHNEQRRALFAANRAKDMNSLVFVGDSITEGWNGLLQTDFSDLHVTVVNRGIGGDTTPNLLYRLDDDVLSLHPVGLVILIGTNDLGEKTPVSDIAYNLHLLRLKIREKYPNIPIAWCLVMPRGGDHGYDFLPRIQELNSNIRAEAKADPLVTVVDTYGALALPDGTYNPADFKPDHLHLVPAGYEAWNQVLHPVLERWHL